VAGKRVEFSLAKTDLGTTMTMVGNAIALDGRGGDMLVEVANLDASIALADFEVMVKAHPDADWVALVTGTGWGTVAGALKHAPVDIHTLAANSKAVVRVDVGQAYQMKFQAKAASGTISITVKGTVEYA
jgi:hypothetical protein